MMDIPTRYDFRNTETRIYKLWQKNHCFDSSFDGEGHSNDKHSINKPKFTIVIPPPNVTGRLHMGHALNNTIQDVLVRYKRMDGYDALWLPGTDHAGISTQTVVRKHLDAKGIDYRELGREKFIEQVWNWKTKYGQVILTQLEKLGCSCDWRRTTFTMDDMPSHGVRTAFKTLFDRGLLYRGKRIVNWCPVDQTALSDDEVITKDGGEPSHLWYINYYLVHPTNNIEYITVATTRPETLFGDVGIAVHPDDERYKSIIGKQISLPLTERVIPIIADDYVDKSFGTGCLKITPAHDPNDFELGKRHHLEPINIMHDDASMNENVPEAFRGLDRHKAREAVLQALTTQKLLKKTEDRMVPLGRAQRSGAPIEYRLSDQWFVRMEPLAEKALQASGYIRSSETNEWFKEHSSRLFFHPARWEKTYFRWLSNIRDWTISRQIWWGHRIPAWYHKQTGEIVVDVDTPKIVLSDPDSWYQDPDVLDTWFSSWLWPMTTLGWPDKTKDFDRYYPTTVLSTSKDIIFFWVARMNFAGLEMVNKLPYRDVYIHPTVLDDRGAVMSKSKGNGLDPLAVIEGATKEDLKGPAYEARPSNMNEILARIDKNFPDGFKAVGADALRFTLIYSCSDGQEMRLSLQRFNEIGRRFITKLWNASRFVLLSLDNVPDSDVDMCERSAEDKWINSRAATTIRIVRDSLDSFDFAPVGQNLYRFIWNDYCDWYLELTKPRITGNDKSAARRAGHELGVRLADILLLLHPVCPFITEELWQKLMKAMDDKQLWLNQRPTSDLLITATMPKGTELPDTSLEANFESLQRLVGRIRTIRADTKIAANTKLSVVVKPLAVSMEDLLKKTQPVLLNLANLQTLEVTDEKTTNMVTAVDPTFELYIDLEKYIDIDREIVRIDKEIQSIENKLVQVTKKLENPKFLSGAKSKVIEAQKAKNTELRTMLTKLTTLRKSYKN